MNKDNNIESEFLNRVKQNPFRTPEHYFDTLDDRIMWRIHEEAVKKPRSAKIIQFLKPVLGLAASFALVFLLVYYPINSFLPKTVVQQQTVDTSEYDLLDIYSISLSQMNESSLVNAIFDDNESNSNNINPDDMLAYLSTQVKDIELYTAIQN